MSNKSKNSKEKKRKRNSSKNNDKKKIKKDEDNISNNKIINNKDKSNQNEENLNNNINLKNKEPSNNVEKLNSDNHIFNVIKLENFNEAKIQCLAFNSDYSILASGRSDGEIDLWTNYSNSRTCFRKLPGKFNTSNQSLCWIKRDGKEILISAGLHGWITEWDLSNLIPKKIEVANGGGIWKMKYCEKNNQIGIATESGMTLIYDNELNYVKQFQPTNWNKSCKRI
jgi:WD40 repeat protein